MCFPKFILVFYIILPILCVGLRHIFPHRLHGCVAAGSRAVAAGQTKFCAFRLRVHGDLRNISQCNCGVTTGEYAMGLGHRQ